MINCFLQASSATGVRTHNTSKVARAAAAVRPAVSSRLSGVEMAPPDPILGVSEAFKASKSPDKLNLGVGAYRTEELQPYVLEVVKKAGLTASPAHS